jgi:rRNA maturation RNase YbeY
LQTKKINKAKVSIIINYKEAFPFKRNIIRKKIVTLIDEIAIKEKKNIESVNFLFCSDEEILEYNTKYLSHKYFTDIITFYYPEKDYIDADVLISLDTVFRNSRKYRVNIQIELWRVIIHGILHICGYKDKTNEQKLRMRLKENDYLKQVSRT